MILLVKRLSKAEMTPYLIYADFTAQIRSSSGLFLCSWLTVALLGPACGPDLAKRNEPPKGRHSLLHVGQIIFTHVADLGHQNVAMWVLTYKKKS